MYACSWSAYCSSSRITLIASISRGAAAASVQAAAITGSTFDRTAGGVRLLRTDCARRQQNGRNPEHGHPERSE